MHDSNARMRVNGVNQSHVELMESVLWTPLETQSVAAPSLETVKLVLPAAKITPSKRVLAKGAGDELSSVGPELNVSPTTPATPSASRPSRPPSASGARPAA